MPQYETGVFTQNFSDEKAIAAPFSVGLWAIYFCVTGFNCDNAFDISYNFT
jgi:hypothetical protein